MTLRSPNRCEHTVLITDTGAAILTVTSDGQTAAGSPDTLRAAR